jgi:hypothetical protein
MRLYSVLFLALLVVQACSKSPARSTKDAPWRGTAWDNPDSIRAGLSRGECWPLIEDSILWSPCVARADSLMLLRGRP